MSERQRRRLVDQLRRASVIRSGPVRDAFLAVPREQFIPDVLATRGIEAVYRDEAYPTRTDPLGNAISSSSQPGIMASMLEELRLEPGHRVLEIGAGTGYNAALLSFLVGQQGRVTSVELDPEVAATARAALERSRYGVRVVAGDGRGGWARSAPYDRIIATASSLDVPRAFLDQLVDGGLLVLPLRLTDALPFRQIVVTFERQGNGFVSRSVVGGGFMRLRERPDDLSLPWPELKAEVSVGTRIQEIAIISGSSLDTLSNEARTRLLGTMLGSPRAHALGIRASLWKQFELETFIALAAPEERLVGCSRDELKPLLFLSNALPGIIGRDGRSLAHLSGGRSISRVDAYGGRGSERRLRALVDEWKRRGRPGVDRLRITVSYGSRGSRAWRVRKRGQSVIAFGWNGVTPTRLTSRRSR